MIARKDIAWASEMLDSQDQDLPDLVVEHGSPGVFLMETVTPQGGFDADPAPGLTPRFPNPRIIGQTSPRERIIERQLSKPTVTLNTSTGAAVGQGVFAGARNQPFSVCYVGGNRWRFQGGSFSFQRLAGMTEDPEEPLIYETVEVVVPSKTFSVPSNKSTVIGLHVQAAKSASAWNLTEWTLDATHFEESDPVRAGTFLGMLVAPDGNGGVTYTPFGTSFLPLFVLHTNAFRAFWSVQACLLPPAYINPFIGLLWWS